MNSPEFRRELIRLMNREDFNSTEVSAVLEFAEYMQPFVGASVDELTATALLDVWKESFEDEPQDEGDR